MQPLTYKKEQLSFSQFFSNSSMTLKMGHGHQTSMQMHLKFSLGQHQCRVSKISLSKMTSGKTIATATFLPISQIYQHQMFEQLMLNACKIPRKHAYKFEQSLGPKDSALLNQGWFNFQQDILFVTRTPCHEKIVLDHYSLKWLVTKTVHQFEWHCCSLDQN